MRLIKEIENIRHLRIDRLDDDALFALVSLLTSLNQLVQITGVPEYGTLRDNAELLETIIRQQNNHTTASTVRLANAANYARSMYGTSPYNDDLLQASFDFLDGGVLDSPIDYDTAALISDLFSTCSMSDEDSAPYMDALRSYIADAIEQLEEEIIPLETHPHKNSVEPTDDADAHLVAQLNTLSLIFESGYLLKGEFRLRAIPLFDILRRHVLRRLTDISRTLTAQPDSSLVTRHSSLLSSFSRLLQSDLEGAPSAYYSLLATLAVQGLDALDGKESSQTSELQYASVLADSTLKYECERQNYETYNPFE